MNGAANAAPFVFALLTMASVNRNDFQLLARLRIREARILLRERESSGAYYLAGYAIECALKACIAKQCKRYDFPDKKAVNDAHTHDLDKLAVLAGLRDELNERMQQDLRFARNWAVLKAWSEESRYRLIVEQDSREIVDAILNKSHGVMPWVVRRW